MSCLEPRLRIPVSEDIAAEGEDYWLDAFCQSSNTDLRYWGEKRFHGYSIGKVHNGAVLLSSAVDPLTYLPSISECYPGVQITRCGKCAACRLALRQEWTYRLLLEAEAYPGAALFITLTYDDEHLHHGRCRVRYASNGAPWLEPWPSLEYRDVQLFVKSLRRQMEYRYNRKLKVYYCGEYGSASSRPHYHLLVYGMTLKEALLLNLPHDPRFVGKLGSGQRFSRFIRDLWARGHCAVAAADGPKIQYVAGYVLKKMEADNESRHIVDYYEAMGEVIEWTPGGSKAVRYLDGERLDITYGADQWEYFRGKPRLRRPDLLIEKERRTAGNGIGKSFFDTHFEEIYGDSLTRDSFTISFKGQTLHPHPPAYFDYLYDKIDPEGLSELKEVRRCSSLRSQLSLVELLKKCNISTKTYKNNQRESAERRLAVGAELRGKSSASKL